MLISLQYFTELKNRIFTKKRSNSYELGYTDFSCTIRHYFATI